MGVFIDDDFGHDVRPIFGFSRSEVAFKDGGGTSLSGHDKVSKMHGRLSRLVCRQKKQMHRCFQLNPGLKHQNGTFRHERGVHFEKGGLFRLAARRQVGCDQGRLLF